MVSVLGLFLFYRITATAENRQGGRPFLPAVKPHFVRLEAAAYLDEKYIKNISENMIANMRKGFEIIWHL